MAFRRRRFTSRIFGCVLFASLLLPGQDVSLRKLEVEMDKVSRIAGSAVGATAIHVETGRTVHPNATARFPMASTSKIPVAVTLLELVGRGEEQLGRMVTIEIRDPHPGSGVMSQSFTPPGVALRVRNLLELMLLISCNSATDVLPRLVGGPTAVTAKMRELGLAGSSVDRPTAGLIAGYWGVTKLPHELE